MVKELEETGVILRGGRCLVGDFVCELEGRAIDIAQALTTEETLESAIKVVARTCTLSPREVEVEVRRFIDTLVLLAAGLVPQNDDHFVNEIEVLR